MEREAIIKEISHANNIGDRNFWVDKLIEFDGDEVQQPDLFSEMDMPENTGLFKDDVDFHGDFGTMSQAQQNMIINPKHYKIVPPGDYPDGIEYTGICRLILNDKPLTNFQAHILGQCIKYMCRLGSKDAAAQDAKKLAWYAQYLADDLNGIIRPW